MENGNGKPEKVCITEAVVRSILIRFRYTIFNLPALEGLFKVQKKIPDVCLFLNNISIFATYYTNNTIFYESYLQ